MHLLPNSSRKLPAIQVYDDAHTLAFQPKVAVARGHTVLIPRRHCADLFDIDEDALRYLAVATKRLAAQLIGEHGATGLNVLHASGRDAQQSVFHLHLHLIPRYPQDGLDLWVHQSL